MSSKGSMTLGDLFDMDMDLGSHKLLSNELVAENAVFFQRLFAWLATWLCFYMILAAYAILRVFTVPFRLSCE